MNCRIVSIIVSVSCRYYDLQLFSTLPNSESVYPIDFICKRKQIKLNASHHPIIVFQIWNSFYVNLKEIIAFKLFIKPFPLIFLIKYLQIKSRSKLNINDSQYSIHYRSIETRRFSELKLKIAHSLDSAISGRIKANDPRL